MFNRLLLYLVILSTLMFFGCLIKGRVVDENGVGITGVTVTLSGDVSMTTKTDSNGDYQFGKLNNMLSTGNYTVTPSGFGYSSTPSTKNVTLATLTLEGLGEVTESVAGVDFKLDEVNCANPTPDLIGIWDASQLESGRPMYFHFFDDCRMIIEAGIDPNDSGVGTSSGPIRIYGRYAWTGNEFTFSMYYATDKNLDQINTNDDCWIYSPFYNTVTLSNTYLSGNEFHVNAGGRVSLSPDKPPTCSDDNVIVTTDMIWIVKLSATPGNFLLD